MSDEVPARLYSIAWGEVAKGIVCPVCGKDDTSGRWCYEIGEHPGRCCPCFEEEVKRGDVP